MEPDSDSLKNTTADVLLNSAVSFLPPNCEPLDASAIAALLASDLQEARSGSLSLSSSNVGSEALWLTSELRQAVELFGLVAVEKAFRLDQSETVEEVAAYVERHQGDAGFYTMSLEALEVEKSLEVLAAVFSLYEFGLERPKREKLEVLWKILSQLCKFGDTDPRVRRIRAFKLQEKGLTSLLRGLDPDVGSSKEKTLFTSPLLQSCGFALEEQTTKTAPFKVESVAVFRFEVDSLRIEVQYLHRVLSVLEALLFSTNSVIPDDREYKELFPKDVGSKETLVSENNSPSSSSRPESISAAARAAIARHELSAAGNKPMRSKKTSFAPQQPSVRNPAPDSSTNKVDAGFYLASPGMSREAIGALHERRAKNPLAFHRSNVALTLRHRLQAEASPAREALPVSPNVAESEDSAFSSPGKALGSVWRLFGLNSGVENPLLNEAVVTEDTQPLLASDSGGEKMDDNSKSPSRDEENPSFDQNPYSFDAHRDGSKAYVRRSQHFTLKDIENIRYKDAIATCPRYAEEWWNEEMEANSKKSSSYASVRTRSYHPAYVGRRALDLTNDFRATHGLPPLKWHEGICEVGKKHAEQMAVGDAPFNHDKFDERVRAMPVFSYSSAENLAYNEGVSDPAFVAVEGWIKSPGHCKNLLSLTNVCGIGVAQNSAGRFYFTQLFAKTSGGLA